MDFSVPDATVGGAGKTQKVCMIDLYHVPRHQLLLPVVKAVLDGALVRPRSLYVPVRSMRNNKMSKKRMEKILSYSENSLSWDVVLLYVLSTSILLEM